MLLLSPFPCTSESWGGRETKDGLRRQLCALRGAPEKPGSALPWPSLHPHPLQKLDGLGFCAQDLLAAGRPHVGAAPQRQALETLAKLLKVQGGFSWFLADACLIQHGLLNEWYAGQWTI